jgi:NAD(P)H-flavin reductase
VAPAVAANPYALEPAVVEEKVTEAPGIYTFGLRLVDTEARRRYRFAAGQFNMLYVLGVGEVPISIVSDPDEPELLRHTIRVVGRVTEAMGRLRPGDPIGVRGPYGRGWPLEAARGRDVMIVTGGLGCAPVVGAVEYVFRRRSAYGAVKILHGVKTPRDLLYRARFAAWRRHPDTEVLLASDQPGKAWRHHIGVVTELFEQVTVDPARIVVMMCGPEIMMRLGTRILAQRGVPLDAIYVSLERNMQCGIGLCGHCQMGPFFLCTDGPVMRYDAIVPLLSTPGV